MATDGKVTILEAKEARDIAFKILKEAGIEDAVTVKVRPFTGDKEKWIALYRGLSQFRGRPIIWLNEELDDLMDEYDVPEDRRFDILVDDILHEYAHIIAEWGRIRDHRITDLITESWGDEEDYAESFILYIKDTPLQPPLLDIVDFYKEAFPETKDAPKVRKVGKNVLKDYQGMNREAAKAFGFTPLPKKDEVLVSKDLKGKEFRETVKHEVVEQELMEKGSKYWPAHKQALKEEKHAPMDAEWTQEQSEASLKEFLEGMVQMRNRVGNPVGWKYNSMEDFVLKNGRWFKPSPLPKGLKRGKMKACFMNATHAMYGGYTYVEGYASSIIPTNHAWVTDKSGKAYDVTWKYDPKNAYFGVPFDKKYVDKTIMEKETYGLIDDWPTRWPLVSGKHTDFIYKGEIEAVAAPTVCPKCGSEGWLDVSGKFQCVKCGHWFREERDPLESKFAPSFPKPPWKTFALGFAGGVLVSWFLRMI